MSLLAGFAACPPPPPTTLVMAELCGAAPLAPAVLLRLVAGMLADRRFSSDHLLIAADAITEAALETAFEGEAVRLRVMSLVNLADRLRGAASTREWDARL